MEHFKVTTFMSGNSLKVKVGSVNNRVNKKKTYYASSNEALKREIATNPSSIDELQNIFQQWIEGFVKNRCSKRTEQHILKKIKKKEHLVQLFSDAKKIAKKIKNDN